MVYGTLIADAEKETPQKCVYMMVSVIQTLGYWILLGIPNAQDWMEFVIQTMTKDAILTALRILFAEEPVQMTQPCVFPPATILHAKTAKANALQVAPQNQQDGTLTSFAEGTCLISKKITPIPYS